MNDTEIFEHIHASVSDAHMATPLEAIIARGHARQHHHRRLAAAVAAATIMLTAGLIIVDDQGHNPSTPNPARAQLAAFTVAAAPDGTTALTLRKGSEYRLNPDALRQALAAHNIPAVVTVGETCDTTPQPAGLDEVVTAQRDAAGAVYLTINPAALPPDAKLSIGYYPTHTTFSLIDPTAPLHCANNGT
jgi:hypothetical protein